MKVFLVIQTYSTSPLQALCSGLFGLHRLFATLAGALFETENGLLVLTNVYEAGKPDLLYKPIMPIAAHGLQ
jgi:hypothetical protein